MSNSPNQIPVFINPRIKNLNVRQISKMIASKIIETTALQLHLNPSFCNQLSVSNHLNTYEAVTYFVDNQFFERYGFDISRLITFQEFYDEFWAEFSCRVNYPTAI